MADTAEEDEEVEDGVHIFLLVEGIEDGTSDVGNTLSNKPYDGSSRDSIQQGFEGYQYTQAHADKTKRLDVRMLFQFDETDDRTNNGTCPNEDKQYPAPVTTYATSPSISSDEAGCDR